MIGERTVEIQLAYLPYKRFSGLGPGEGMDSDEADEVVFNLERNRLKSVPISKVPTPPYSSRFSVQHLGRP